MFGTLTSVFYVDALWCCCPTLGRGGASTSIGCDHQREHVFHCKKNPAFGSHEMRRCQFFGWCAAVQLRSLRSALSMPFSFRLSVSSGSTEYLRRPFLSPQSATITGGLILAGVKFGADKPDAKPVEFIFTLAKIFGNGAQVSEWARLDLSGCRADFTDATLRRIDMTEAKLGSANVNRTTLALCTLDKADFSSALNVETAKFGVPLGHPHMSDTSEFFNLKWGTAALDASAVKIEDEVACRHFIVWRSQAEGLLPAGRRFEGVAECARGSDQGLQFHFTGSFQALDPKDQAVWGQKQYTEWGVEGHTNVKGHPGSTSRWNHQAAIPIGSIKLQVQRADNWVDKLEGVLWLTEKLLPNGPKFKMVPTTFFTVRAVDMTSQKDPTAAECFPKLCTAGVSAAPKEWEVEQYISGSAVSAPPPRKAVRYSPGARISEINAPRSLAPSCFDAPDGNGHEMFQKLPYFPPWRSSKHGVGWFGFMGWYLSRYGSAENDLMLQDKSINDLLDTFARMTTNSVTKENWTAYRLEWMVLRDMAQRTQKLDYNKGNDQSENEVMLNIVKLIFFSFERDIDRTSAAASAEGQKTADFIKDIAKRVKAVWSSGNSSAHSWGSSPSEILDSIAVIAPCYLLGSPPPGVLQAFEDLERPLRGEILVDIKTVRTPLSVPLEASPMSFLAPVLRSSAPLLAATSCPDAAFHFLKCAYLSCVLWDSMRVAPTRARRCSTPNVSGSRSSVIVVSTTRRRLGTSCSRLSSRSSPFWATSCTTFRLFGPGSTTSTAPGTEQSTHVVRQPLPDRLDLFFGPFGRTRTPANHHKSSSAARETELHPDKVDEPSAFSSN